jgi:hypothetical protein
MSYILPEVGLSLDRFSKYVPNIKFRPVKGELIHAEADTDTGTGTGAGAGTDWHDDMAKLQTIFVTMRTRLDIGVAWLITLGQGGGEEEVKSSTGITYFNLLKPAGYSTYHQV